MSRVRTRLLVFVVGSMCVLPLASFARVPSEILDDLARGINLETWMQTLKPGRYALSLDELKHLQQSGFTHVRLPFNPALLVEDEEQAFHQLDEALAKCDKAGLAVIVDFHPGAGMPNEWKDPSRKYGLASSLWDKLAHHLAGTDPRKVVVELFNEPSGSSTEWQGPMEELFSKVRNILPDHTIIIGSGDANSPESLIALKPVKDNNVVYNFHFYWPFWFTHQGATWTLNKFLKEAREVPFPPRETKVSRTLMKRLKTEDPSRASELQEYLRSDEGVEHIESAFASVRAWAERNDVSVTVNEFGAIRDAPRPEDRFRWLEAVRKAAENNHIGWTVWEHGSVFGLYRRGRDGEWVPDNSALKALGMP